MIPWMGLIIVIGLAIAGFAAMRGIEAYGMSIGADAHDFNYKSGLNSKRQILQVSKIAHMLFMLLVGIAFIFFGLQLAFYALEKISDPSHQVAGIAGGLVEIAGVFVIARGLAWKPSYERARNAALPDSSGAHLKRGSASPLAVQPVADGSAAFNLLKSAAGTPQDKQLPSEWHNARAWIIGGVLIILLLCILAYLGIFVLDLTPVRP